MSASITLRPAAGNDPYTGEGALPPFEVNGSRIPRWWMNNYMNLKSDSKWKQFSLREHYDAAFIGRAVRSRARHQVRGRMLIEHALAFPQAINFSEEFQACTSTVQRTTARLPKNCSDLFRVRLSINATNLLKGLAPQAGFEPATLRLTATLFETTGNYSRQRQRISLATSSAGGNPRRPDSAPDCPEFVPFSNPAPNRRVDARRLTSASAGVSSLIGGVYV
jgi:hypothetical protein